MVSPVSLLLYCLYSPAGRYPVTRGPVLTAFATVFFANSAIKRISSQTQAQIRRMIRLPYFICFALFTICMVIWVMHPASVTAYIVGAWWSQAFLWLASLVDNFGSLVMDLLWPHLHVN